MKATTAPIILIPHPHLRTVARPVPTPTPNVQVFANKLGETLRQTKNPQGVGLAAPQIDQDWRLFATQFEKKIELYFNPVIAKHSAELSFGENEEDPDLEGCLSIPKLYGPVPRWSWVELEFDRPEGEHFVRERRHFTDFSARVVQHELDHLDGTLFIDYSFKMDLPVYSADSRSDRMIEVPRSIFETLYQSTVIKQ